MSEIKITGTLVRTDPSDSYPTHIANYGKGGYMTVDNFQQLGAIPTSQLVLGTAVYVQTKAGIYIYDGNSSSTPDGKPALWRSLFGGGGGGTPGQSIENTPIGSETPSTGRFTTLEATVNIKAPDITIGDTSLQSLGIQQVVKKPTKLYVDSDSPSINDRLTNDGQNPNLPFKTINRALLEAAKVSKTYDKDDRYDSIAIDLAPGVYLVDNRPGKFLANTYLLQASDNPNLTDLPQYYNSTIINDNSFKHTTYVNIAAILKYNAANITLQLYNFINNDTTRKAIVGEANLGRCKTDISLLVEAIHKDVEAAGNINSVVFARAYRRPDNSFSDVYLNSNQRTLFGEVVDTFIGLVDSVCENDGDDNRFSYFELGGGKTIKKDSPAFTAITNYIKNKLLLPIKYALTDSNTNANPWLDTNVTVNNKDYHYKLTRGVLANYAGVTVKPSLEDFNPPKVIIDQDTNSVVSESTYNAYKNLEATLKSNRTSYIRQAFRAQYAGSSPTDGDINAFIDSGAIGTSLTNTHWKCLRDLIIVYDTIRKDLLNYSNVHILDVAKLYIDAYGVRSSFMEDSTELSGMLTCLQKLRTDVNTDVNDAKFSDLVDHLIRALRTDSTFVNPHTVVEKRGVIILAGGVTVPKGVSFVSTDLRKTEIRPLYIGQDDPNFTTFAPIFKVTGGTYAYGMTFKDHPGVPWTHHKVVCVCFSNDDWEFNDSYNTDSADPSYYKKVGKAFQNNTSYYTQTTQEVTIVGPADTFQDRPKTDTVKGSSPYIYNCSVRSEWGMNGAWIDGARVKGFKSFVTAQFTQTIIQRDKRAYEKWNGNLLRWEDLSSSDLYYELVPALFSDYVHGISPSDQTPTNNSIRYKRSRLFGGIMGTDWRNFGFNATNNAFIQIVSCFCIGPSEGYIAESGADMSITNSNTNFGETALAAYGFKSEAAEPDKDFTIQSVIKPKPLTASNIINFNTFKPDIDSSYAYYSGLSTPTNNRVYVEGVIVESRVKPFTFKAGTKIYFKIASNSGPFEVSAELVAVNGKTFDVDSTKHYFNVVAGTNNIFTYREGNQSLNIFTIASPTDRATKINSYKTSAGNSTLYIKRVVDTRETKDKAYRLNLTWSSTLPKRLPPYGFLISHSSTAIGSKLWVCSSEEVKVNGSVVAYDITLLGFTKESKPSENVVTPYTISDLDFEPVIDNNVVTSPVYNPSTSPTYRCVLNLLKSFNKIGTDEDAGQITEASLLTPGNNVFTSNISGIRFLRPSIGRCSGHTFEYAGYINYSQGLPQYQQVNIFAASRLTKNRKNIGGGLFYYSGLDHEGLNWTGDTATNLATGESFSLSVSDSIVDVTVPATFDDLEANLFKVKQSSVQLDSNGLNLPTGTYINMGGPLFYASGSTPTNAAAPGTIVLNNSTTNAYPLAYKYITANGQGQWIQIGSESYVNINLTGNFNALNNAVSISSTNQTLSVTGGVTISSIKPSKLEVYPTGSDSTINNVEIGATIPKSGKFTALNVGTATAATATGDAVVSGILTVQGGFNLETKLGGVVTKQVNITNESSEIDKFNVLDFRSARYQIQVSQGADHQTIDLLIIHDNSTVSYIEYGNLSTGNIQITTPDISLVTESSNKFISVKLIRTNLSNTCQVVYNRYILKSALIAPTGISTNETI